ncbi:MAG: hypothetical protein RBQ78_05465 [Acholeplasmataceae bacterium]|jgi:hypothetical protein|nr:hypothetical protein [Acholeplasmataceae bacterium]
MDIFRLLNENGVQLQTENHKHCRPGWGNISCPFCTGNPGLHLGFTLDGRYSYCWRCGWKPLPTAIAALLKIPEYRAKELISLYGGASTVSIKPTKYREFTLPSDIQELTFAHKTYLHGRGFDPIHIAQQWKIASLGPASILKDEEREIHYKNRIFIPIFWENKMVSFQTRTTTKSVELRYIACPKEYEIMNHQRILYGNQYGWTDTGICVEGVTDVWRFGVRSFATFGIEFTHRQIRYMAKRFKRVVVIFDDDPQAQIQANKVITELAMRGIPAYTEIIKGDPGGLPQAEADYIIKNIR